VRRALFLPAKAPRPGRTKTRLSPPLSLEQAADLYRAFLQDCVGLALALGPDRVAVRFPAEPGAEAELAALLPPEVRLQPRPGDDFGQILRGGFEGHLAEGFERVVTIGSDNPTLPPSLVEAAWRGLDDHDVVISRSADGGYCLLGMSRPQPGLFRDVAWSTDLVYEQTLERAHDLGLRVLPLAEWYDVDTVADLARVRADLASMPPDAAPATRAALAELPW
jgi:rSAM/selenodomain-associated transferase 1